MLTGLTEVVILQNIHIANFYVAHPGWINCYVNLWGERKLPKMARSGSLAPGLVNNYVPAEITCSTAQARHGAPARSWAVCRTCTSAPLKRRAGYRCIRVWGQPREEKTTGRLLPQPGVTALCQLLPWLLAEDNKHVCSSYSSPGLLQPLTLRFAYAALNEQCAPWDSRRLVLWAGPAIYSYTCFLKNVNTAQPCPTLCDPMDYTVHGVLQARILQWVAVPFSRTSSQPRDLTKVSHIAGRFFTSWVKRKAQEYWSG